MGSYFVCVGCGKSDESEGLLDECCGVGIDELCIPCGCYIEECEC